MLANFVQQPVRSTVHIGAAQHMVTGRQQINHGRDSRHPGAVDQRVLGVVQCYQTFLQDRTDWIATSRVLETLYKLL